MQGAPWEPHYVSNRAWQAYAWNFFKNSGGWVGPQRPSTHPAKDPAVHSDPPDTHHPHRRHKQSRSQANSDGSVGSIRKPERIAELERDRILQSNGRSSAPGRVEVQLYGAIL